jgi:hypothetical protein
VENREAFSTVQALGLREKQSENPTQEVLPGNKQPTISPHNRAKSQSETNNLQKTPQNVANI